MRERCVQPQTRAMYRPYGFSETWKTTVVPGQGVSRTLEQYTPDVDELRWVQEQKLRQRFESVFEKYDRDFGHASDVIDLVTGEVIVNNGHLRHMQHEQDVGRRALQRESMEADDELLSPAAESSELGRLEIDDSEGERLTEISEDRPEHLPVDSDVDKLLNAAERGDSFNILDPEFIKSYCGIAKQMQEYARILLSSQTPRTQSNPGIFEGRRQLQSAPTPRVNRPNVDRSQSSVPMRSYTVGQRQQSSPTAMRPSSRATGFHSGARRSNTVAPQQRQASPITMGPSLWAMEDDAINDQGHAARTNWTEEDDQVLIRLLKTTSLSMKEITERIPNRKYWDVRKRTHHLASYIPGISVPSRSGRASRSEKPSGSSSEYRQAEGRDESLTLHVEENNLQSDRATQYISPENWNLHNPVGSSYTADRERTSQAEIENNSFMRPPRVSKINQRYKPIVENELSSRPNFSSSNQQDEPTGDFELPLQQIISSRKPMWRGRWTEEEDERLIYLHEQKGLSFEKLLPYFPDRSRSTIMSRYTGKLKSNAPKTLYRASPEIPGPETSSRANLSQPKQNKVMPMSRQSPPVTVDPSTPSVLTPGRPVRNKTTLAATRASKRIKQNENKYTSVPTTNSKSSNIRRPPPQIRDRRQHAQADGLIEGEASRVESHAPLHNDLSTERSSSANPTSILGRDNGLISNRSLHERAPSEFDVDRPRKLGLSKTANGNALRSKALIDDSPIPSRQVQNTIYPKPSEPQHNLPTPQSLKAGPGSSSSIAEPSLVEPHISTPMPAPRSKQIVVSVPRKPRNDTTATKHGRASINDVDLGSEDELDQ